MSKWLLAMTVLYVGIGITTTIALNKWIESMIDWTNEKYGCGDRLLWKIQNKTLAMIVTVAIIVLWPISYPIRIGHVAIKYFAIKREYLKEKEEREKTEAMIEDLFNKWYSEKETA